MRYRPLGTSGLVVSGVALGCATFGGPLDLEATRGVVAAALDSGITLFDTADAYGDSEELLAQALDGHRDEIVLATKFGLPLGGAVNERLGPRASRRYIRAAVERSLRRLRTDHIDLYQLHCPDGVTPIEETLSSLTELVREGKVRYIGSSNFASWQIADADWTARTKRIEHFISAQNQYSFVERGVEREVVPACAHLGIGILAFLPLANGLLTGKYRRGERAPSGARLERQGEWLTADRFDLVEALEHFGALRGVSLLEVALGALAAQPAVSSVITGATSPEQIRQNAAAGAWQPSAADLASLQELIGPPPAR